MPLGSSLTLGSSNIDLSDGVLKSPMVYIVSQMK